MEHIAFAEYKHLTKNGYPCTDPIQVEMSRGEDDEYHLMFDPTPPGCTECGRIYDAADDDAIEALVEQVRANYKPQPLPRIPVKYKLIDKTIEMTAIGADAAMGLRVVMAHPEVVNYELISAEVLHVPGNRATLTKAIESLNKAEAWIPGMQEFAEAPDHIEFELYQVKLVLSYSLEVQE